MFLDNKKIFETKHQISIQTNNIERRGRERSFSKTSPEGRIKQPLSNSTLISTETYLPRFYCPNEIKIRSRKMQEKMRSATLCTDRKPAIETSNSYSFPLPPWLQQSTSHAQLQWPHGRHAPTSAAAPAPELRPCWRSESSDCCDKAQARDGVAGQRDGWRVRDLRKVSVMPRWRH